MQKRLTSVIHGRVRGVMYRDTTARHAQTLAIKGFVENQTDNTVLVVAEGEEESLHTLLKYLWRGTPFSKVEQVEEKWSEATGEFSDFEIRYRSFLD